MRGQIQEKYRGMDVVTRRNGRDLALRGIGRKHDGQKFNRGDALGMIEVRR